MNENLNKFFYLRIPFVFARQHRCPQVMNFNAHAYLKIIEVLPMAINTTDAEGQLTHFNKAVVEFSGRVPEMDTDKCSTFGVIKNTNRTTPEFHADKDVTEDILPRLKTGKE